MLFLVVIGKLVISSRMPASALLRDGLSSNGLAAEFSLQFSLEPAFLLLGLSNRVAEADSSAFLPSLSFLERRRFDDV